MKCVTSVRFSVRVNGELQPFFNPSRGLRQGCPVSPYLFLFYAEGFSSLLKYYGNYVDRGIKVNFRAPWLSHLLFADDSLIFIKADTKSARRLNEILEIYGEALGQSVNRSKSSIFFSPNTPTTLRQSLKQTLGVLVEAFSERYLGLPTVVGKINSGTFEYLGDRAHGYMQGWSERLFACAGREALLKSIVQAIPMFSMSCFLLTKKVCKGLTSNMAKFWWGSFIDRRSLHWIAWDKLATPKCNGGMGFRDRSFN